MYTVHSVPLFLRWNRTQSQLSSPVLLQESVSCKFTLLARVYYRPRYFLGVGAKLHALPHTSHPYVGDRELQKITISSTVVREKQVSEHFATNVPLSTVCGVMIYIDSFNLIQKVVMRIY